MDEQFINELVELTAQWRDRIKESAAVTVTASDSKMADFQLGTILGYEQCSAELTAILSMYLKAKGLLNPLKEWTEPEA